MKKHLYALITFYLAVHIFSQVCAEFSDPNFVEETVYEGNGMVAMAFGPEERIYVIEKQGRLLLLEPNDQPELSISYQYYEGNWTSLPEVDSLSPLATGTLNEFSIEPRQRDDGFMFRYTATLPLSEAGTYTFYTRSDDGSRLFVNGIETVDNDGLHGAIEASGSVELSEGTHTVVVDYFEAGGGEVLEVFWEGPGFDKQPLGGAGSAYKPPHVVADLRAEVSTNGERGLLGLALDPDFENNRHLYLFYSTENDQRLTRFTLDGTFQNALPSNTVLLLSGLPNDTYVHNAGDILFHPADPHVLYVILGDDGNRNVVSNLDVYNGKILRVDPATGLGLPQNPFWNGDADSVRSRVWAHSFRNPFRVAFDPAAPLDEVLYISENGDGTDRLACIEIGADGGWPSNFTTDSADGKRKILRTASPSVTAIAILRGGPFAPGGPVVYQARYGSEIRRWNLVGEDLDSLESIPGDGGQPFLTQPLGALVHFSPGPDGALYYTSTNQGDSLGTGYRMVRIRYQGGEAPVAGFNLAGGATGELPYPVNFTDMSNSPGATLATWNWDFGDGNHATSPNPQHSYTSPGVYTVTLTVTDNAGLVDSASATVSVYVSVPLTVTGTILDARNLPPSSVAETIFLHLLQEDGETPVTAEGGSGAFSNTFSVDPPGAFSIQTVVQLTGPALVIDFQGGEGADFVPLRRGFAIDLNEGGTLTATVPLSDTALYGRVLDTRQQAADTDIGLAGGLPPAPYAFAGGRDHPAYNSPAPTGIPHRLDPDALGYFYFPIRAEDGGMEFQLDTAGDRNQHVYGRITLPVSVPAGTGVQRDLILGLFDGGSEPDDLSGIPETPAVAYSQDVQTVFNQSCIGCHNDIATNSGGLDLQETASFAALVNRFSVQAPGIKLVEPGSPQRSYLMEKINSGQPQAGTRMRPGDPMDPAAQALLRDWIRQLTPYAVWKDDVFSQPGATAPAEDYDEDGIPNFLEFVLGSNPVLPDNQQANVIISSPTRELTTLRIPPPGEAFSIRWERTYSLSGEDWQTVAERPARSDWSVTPGYQIQTDPVSRELLLSPPASPLSPESRFYRLVVEFQ